VSAGVNFTPWLTAKVDTNPTAKTPVLIVPGLFGTEMFTGETRLWASILRMINPLNSDSFMDPLAFNSNLTPSDPNVFYGSIIGNPDNLYNYSDALVQQFISQGYSLGTNLFIFPYDWRYGVSEDVVSQLKSEIQRDLLKAGSDKINIVAHSTGGLIVKKYVQENLADNYIDKAVFVGVPNLGAPKAFKALINGDNFNIPGLSESEMKKIAQNLPVAYDLAPDKEYVSQIGSFFRKGVDISTGQLGQYLNYNDTLTEFEQLNLVNNQGVINSELLHTSEFDNFDLRTAGINVYNIIGCKSATFGNFTENTASNTLPYFDFPKITSGDGTVPLLSAQTIPADPDNIFFLRNADHGKLLSANGSRQQIVNIITGSHLDQGPDLFYNIDVRLNPDFCQITGENLKIKSPLSINVIDQDGNHSGPLPDGSIENSIPGADYEVWGDHKYVFLPTDGGQQYDISLEGTGNGTFTLQDETIENGETTGTQVFSNLPVTTDLKGLVNLGLEGTTLDLDNNGDDIIDQTVLPTSIVNSLASDDIIPPVTTAVVIGNQGQVGFYKSDVSVSLSALDPEVDGQAASGLQIILYTLDHGQTFNNYSKPLSFSAEGNYSVEFYSIDNMGNKEEQQTINFTIDKSAPEVGLKFDPIQRDLIFSGIDNLATDITLTDNGSKVIITDQAGNITEMNYVEPNRKKSLSATLQNLKYNGTSVDLSKNKLAFSWKYDSKNNLTNLTQSVQSKNGFSISAVFNGTSTSITGRDETGKINQTKAGLYLLQIYTIRGDLGWR
jgi:hypothetical protein